MQQRENQMLEKLAEARTRRARAMERFAVATARVLQVEKRIQAIRERFQSAPSDADCDSDTNADASPPAHQDPVAGEELITAILAITQTEPASLQPQAGEAKPQEELQVQDATGEQDTSGSGGDATGEQDTSGSEGDTTVRLPTMRRRRPRETTQEAARGPEGDTRKDERKEGVNDGEQ